MDLFPFATNRNLSRSSMKEYRIILAEDHVLFRRLVCQELNNAEGLKVVGEANDGQLYEPRQVLPLEAIVLENGKNEENK